MLAKYLPIFTKEIENFPCKNKHDEGIGLIGLHVSYNILFHIVEWKTPTKKLEQISFIILYIQWI
jgi:hypothetical protein